MRITGTVLFFKPGGWGFIELPDKTNVFVHLSNIEGNVRLDAGDRVEFEVGPSRNVGGKSQALNVKIIERVAAQVVRS